MTTPRDPDRLLVAYLAEGMDILSDRVVDAVLDEAHRTRQRVMPSPLTRVSPAAIAVGVAAVVVAAIGFALITRPEPSVGAPSPTGTPSSDPRQTLAPISLTGQIALERLVDGNLDLYMMNLDGTGLVRLTDDPATDHHATWSPDGRLLIFSRQTAPDPEESDIYALDVESGIETQLTVEPGRDAEPRVSPDGTRIAYDHGPADPGIYVMDIDGSNVGLVNVFPSDVDSLIGWSADGASLYYLHQGAEIMKVDLDGGGPVPVVADGTHDNVHISPDGSMFAFQSDRDPGGNFLMNVDGSDVRHIFGAGTEGRPMWWAATRDLLMYIDTDGWINFVRPDGTELPRWEQGRWAAWRPDP